ncbi:MAG: tetratricopeptide repeat protein, partial [Planctomycetaceae bacterium]
MTRNRLILPVLVAAGLVVIAGIFLQPRPDAVFSDSLKALDDGDLETVLRGIESLQGQPDYDSHVHLLRGGYLLRRGDPAAALPSFKSVVPKGELRQAALRLTGECLFLLHQLPLAAAQFQELLKDDPASAESHRWLGQIFYNLGAFDGAVTHLEKLLQYEPDNYLAHALIGHMAFDFGDFKVSVDHYRKALARERPETIPASIHQEV